MRAHATRLLSHLLWPGLLLFAAPLAAQTAEFAVEDLLRPSASKEVFFADAEWPLPSRLDRPSTMFGAEGHWHRIDSEPHLLMPALTFGDRGLPDGPFDEASLLAAVAELADLSPGSLRIVRRGSERRLQGDAPEAIQGAIDMLRAGLPPTIDLSMRLERLGKGASAWEILLEGSRRLHFGELATLAEIEQRPVIADFDAEIAQSSAVVQPKISPTFAGASISFRARPLPARERAVIEAIVRVADQRPSETIEAHPHIGPIDRLSNEFSESGLCFLLQPDLGSIHEWTGHDGSVLRLTFTPRWNSTALAGSPAFASPLLREPVLGFRYRRDARVENPHSATDLRKAIQSSDSQYSQALRGFDGKQAVMLFDPDRGSGFDDKIAETIETALPPARLSIEVLDHWPDDSEPRSIATITAPVILGHSNCFAGAHEQSYLADWNIEVAQAAHIPDPIPGIVENGYFLTATVLANAAGKPDQVDLEFHLSRLQGIERRQISLNVESISGAGDDPLIRIPQTTVFVEQPIERSLRIRRELPLDENGEATLRRSARLLLGHRHELLIRVKVDA